MSDVDRARALVLRYGWSATAYQILNPGIDRWFSASGDAVIGFVERGGVRVVAGAPVCPPDRIPAVVGEFRAASRAIGCTICYFAAERRLHELLAGDDGHASVLIGAQPVWPPRAWPAMLESHASLRQQINRARNKGVSVTRWPSERATDDPALLACLHEWLGGRGLPPLHFLVEPRTLSRLEDRMIFVAERDTRVVAFLVASPVPLRRGWLIEQIVRGTDAPNGTAELLIHAAVSAMAANDDDLVTLGLAPLSLHAGTPGRHGPVWLAVLLRWVRAHVHRFYNFEGLESFKAKFRPSAWEPVYLIVDEPRVTLRALHAVARAFSGGPVSSTLARAMLSALRQEALWMARSD